MSDGLAVSTRCCTLCVSTFDSKNDLTAHLVVEHMQWFRFRCAFCKFVYLPTEKDVTEHFNSTHKGIPPQAIYFCDVTKSDELDAHLEYSMLISQQIDGSRGAHGKNAPHLASETNLNSLNETRETANTHTDVNRRRNDEDNDRTPSPEDDTSQPPALSIYTESTFPPISFANINTTRKPPRRNNRRVSSPNFVTLQSSQDTADVKDTNTPVDALTAATAEESSGEENVMSISVANMNITRKPPRRNPRRVSSTKFVTLQPLQDTADEKDANISVDALIAATAAESSGEESVLSISVANTNTTRKPPRRNHRRVSSRNFVTLQTSQDTADAKDPNISVDALTAKTAVTFQPSQDTADVEDTNVSVDALTAATAAESSGEDNGQSIPFTCSPEEDKMPPDDSKGDANLAVLPNTYWVGARGRRSLLPCSWSACQVVCRDRTELALHTMTHTGERPHRCTWAGCPRGFIRKTHLRQHVLTHTGERPLRCPWPDCQKRCTASTNMARHIRTHTGDKPFQCSWPGCDKRYIGSTALRRHVRVHTGERPYSCRQCGMTFTLKNTVKRHERRWCASAAGDVL